MLPNAYSPLLTKHSVVANTLFRLKEIAIRGLNSAMTPSDRDNLAAEIVTLRDHLMTLANTRTDNRFIFGGYAMSAPPYDNAFNFVGDTNTTSVVVGDGAFIEATARGGAAFGDGTPATVDVFANINALETAVRLGIEVDMQNELGHWNSPLSRVFQRVAQLVFNYRALKRTKRC